MVGATVGQPVRADRRPLAHAARSIAAASPASPRAGCWRTCRAPREARPAARPKSATPTRFFCAMPCAVSFRSRGSACAQWPAHRGRRRAAAAPGRRAARFRHGESEWPKHRAVAARARCSPLIAAAARRQSAAAAGSGSATRLRRRAAGRRAGQRRACWSSRAMASTPCSRKLRAAGVTEGSDLEWQALARQMGVAGRLQAGEYALEPRHHAARTAAPHARRRSDPAHVHHRRRLELPRAARRAGQADAAGARNRASSTTRELMEKLGRPGSIPEGRFLPETYVYTRGDSDLDVLERAAQGDGRGAGRGLGRARRRTCRSKSPDELLTLASIVEKETGLAARAAADRRRVRAPPASSACGCRPTRP